MAANVFVMGLNNFNRELLERIRGAEDYAFHGLVPSDKVEEPERYRIREMLGEAEAQLDAFSGSIDAIVGYIDIPVGTVLPILCRRHGLPGPSLESVLRCQHKYWARLLQARTVPDHVPRFALVDPFAADPGAGLDLEFPFWLKPVKSAGSYLGFRIGGPRELRDKLARIRQSIGRLAEPFDYLVRLAGVHQGPDALDFTHCIAEEIIGGRQCTLEGFVHQGRVHFYGAVDSFRHPNRPTFLRYQYPSRLPVGVRNRMEKVVERALGGTGLEECPFNAELFWERPRDRIWLLEINTRISQSHSDLFHLVDGSSNHQVMVELGLGKAPAMPHREGRYACAAKFFLRRFEDAVVEAVPSPAEIARVREAFPGSRVKINVQPGTRLSHLREQDSYSYDLGWVFLGGRSPRGLRECYRRAEAMLPFRLARV